MNDEFLHALRRDPPPEFARALKRRLQRLPARRGAWSLVVRTMLAVFLIGGVAMAAALLLRDRPEPKREAAPVAQMPAPKESPRAAPPAPPPQPARKVASAPSPEPEPEAQGSGAMGEQVSVIAATPLTQPLVEALTSVLKGFGSYAPLRSMIVEEDEAFRDLCERTAFVFASRRMEPAELALCKSLGTDIAEWHIGYQAVVLTAGPTAQRAALTPRDVFLALARRIPDPAEPSRLIDNPHSTWRDVDARFDFRSIEVRAPSDPTAMALFVRLVMEPGCETYPWIRSLRQTDRRRFDDICHQLRSDGRYREVALTDMFVTQQLWAEPNWLVVLSYRSYDDYRGKLLSTMLAGPAPTLASFADGTYAASRPVYIYAQRRLLDWNRTAWVLARAMTDESVVGPHGYLARHGLVSLDEVERSKQREEHSQ